MEYGNLENSATFTSICNNCNNAVAGRDCIAREQESFFCNAPIVRWLMLTALRLLFASSYFASVVAQMTGSTKP